MYRWPHGGSQVPEMSYFKPEIDDLIKIPTPLDRLYLLFQEFLQTLTAMVHVIRIVHIEKGSFGWQFR